MINTLNIFSDERRSVYNILLCIDKKKLNWKYARSSFFCEIHDKIIDIYSVSHIESFIIELMWK